MNMRNEWSIDTSNSLIDNFYTKEETLASVVENFEIHRWHTNEGYDVEINGIMERCVIQTSSNPLRDLNDFRKIHCPTTTDIKRGYYVKYEDSVWLVDTNVVNVDGAYLSARMSRCQYVLRWQDKNGNIIEKYGYASDATKYSNGEYSTDNFTIGDNQYSLIIPIDDDTRKLKRGMRFAMDFDDADVPDVYELSNRKVKVNDESMYNRGGTMTVILTLRLFDEQRDKQVLLQNGKIVWICDYTEPIKEEESIETPSSITGIINGSDTLRYGQWKTFSASILNEAQEKVDMPYTLNVVCNFVNKLTIINNNDHSLKIRIQDENYIDSSFILQLIINEEVVTQKTILITEGF